MLRFLHDELLEHVGSFVDDGAEETMAVVQYPDPETRSIKGEMRVLRTLTVCKYRDPCLDVRAPEFTRGVYHEPSPHADGSYSFFDRWGNHLTLYTWSSRLEYFPPTRCPIEDKEVPINYYYYDIFVEGRESDLPRTICGKLSKAAAHITIQFDDASLLVLSKYAVLLWDKGKTRFNQKYPCYYSDYNEMVRMGREIPRAHGAISFFRNSAFLYGLPLPKEVHEPRRTSKRLIRYIRLSKSIAIPVRLVANDIALVFGSLAE